MVNFTKETISTSHSLFELNKETDRGAAIIAGSFVELFLENTLRRFFRNDDHAETDLREMFRSTGPLGTFSAKIRLAYLLRMIGNKAQRELTFIKDIRNKFAHQLGKIDFKTQPISQWCAELKLIEGYFQRKDQSARLAGIPGMHFVSAMDKVEEYLADPRNRFVDSCVMFMDTFSYSNAPVFPPIHNDDRPGWPIISWQLSPHP